MFPSCFPYVTEVSIMQKSLNAKELGIIFWQGIRSAHLQHAYVTTTACYPTIFKSNEFFFMKYTLSIKIKQNTSLEKRCTIS